MIHRCANELTAAITALASRHDLVFVDMVNDQEICGPGCWSPDRLHLNTDGHYRVRPAYSRPSATR